MIDLKNWWDNLTIEWKRKFIEMIRKENITPGEFLFLNENTIKNKNLEYLFSRIKTLRIYNEDFKHLPQLSLLNNLHKVAISQSNVSSLDDIGYCPSIEIIELWGVNVSSIGFLKNTPNVRVINLFSTEVKDIRPLIFCSKLEEFRMARHYYDNKDIVHNLDFLVNMKNLKVLHLPKGYSQIDQVAELINLVEFGYRTIDELAPLKNCKKLEKITVVGNQQSNFEDLSPLTKLTKLKHLDISYSQVKSLRPLDKLLDLKTLVVKSTPVSKEHNSFRKRIFGTSEISKFKSKHKSCQVKWK